jgi:hypothetical protein
VAYSFAVLDKKQKIIDAYHVAESDYIAFARAVTALDLPYLERFTSICNDAGVSQGECPIVLRELDKLAASPDGKRIPALIAGVRRITQLAIAENKPLIGLGE